MSNPKWIKGVSGNPKGRPPAIAAITSQIREAVLPELDQIMVAIIAKAKEGDIAAANLLLQRVSPPLKPIQEPVFVGITGNTLTEKAVSVIDAISAGRISPDCGKSILDSLGAAAKIIEVDELTKRIEALEQNR